MFAGPDHIPGWQDAPHLGPNLQHEFSRLLMFHAEGGSPKLLCACAGPVGIPSAAAAGLSLPEVLEHGALLVGPYFGCCCSAQLLLRPLPGAQLAAVLHSAGSHPSGLVTHRPCQGPHCNTTNVHFLGALLPCLHMMCLLMEGSMEYFPAAAERNTQCLK